MFEAGQAGSLRSARITRLPRYYGPVRPVVPHRYARPTGLIPSDFSLGIGTLGSHVPHKSLNTARATSTPVATRTVSRSLPGFSPRPYPKPSFDNKHSLSTPHRWFTCVRLPGSYLTEYLPAFSGRRREYLDYARGRAFEPERLRLGFYILGGPFDDLGRH